MSNRVARNVIKRQKRRVEKDARALARSAHVFVEGLEYDGPLSDEAQAILRLAGRLVQSATRFDGLTDMLEITEDQDDHG